MTDAACQNKEVEDGVHEGFLMKRVEEGACDIADALCYDPDDGSRRHAVNEGFEGDQYGEPHTNETERLDVGVLLQLDKADDGACYGTEPHKGE